MQKIKVVGGFVYPDEKGEITIPPTQTVQMSVSKNNDWVEIPLQSRKKEMKTER